MEQQKDIQNGMHVLYVGWGTVLVSMPLYLLVAWLLMKYNLLEPPLDAAMLSSLRTVLYILVPCTMLLVVFLKRKMVPGKQQQECQPAEAGHVNIAAALPKYISTLFLVWGLTSSIAIYGLVLFLLGGNAMDLYILVCLAAAMSYALRPKQWEILYLAKTIGNTHDKTIK